MLPALTGRNAHAGPQWLVIGELWGCVGGANTNLSHVGPNWACEHRAYSSFECWVLYGQTHYGPTHMCGPTWDQINYVVIPCE